MSPLPQKPELLAPAGDFDCVRAAVENGADAVYFGLQSGFNARARAANFSVEELPAVMNFVHRRGVKGYVTFNTLVFPGELPEAETLLREIAAPQVDAVLVQDLGLVRLARSLCPEDAPMGPLGVRYREEDGFWEICVYPRPVELVGGAADGAVVDPGFSIDLLQLQSLFEELVDVTWSTQGAFDGEPPYVAIEGVFKERAIFLQILSAAPDDEEPGMKFRING